MDEILLIGGTGLLGPTVVRELEVLGKNVVCVNRSGLHPSGGTAITADRNSFDDLRRILREHEPFSLIDMIPYTARQASILLEALEGKQPKFTAVSSIDVYQAYNNLHAQGKVVKETQQVPLFETSKLRDRISFQGLEYDKLNVESIYWSYFDNIALLRMPAIYGLPDTSRIERYFNALTNGEEIVMNSGLANWKFSRSLNSNCAYAIALCTDLVGRHVLNAAEEQHYSEKEWCVLIAELSGLKAKLRMSESAPTPYDMNTQQHWTVDSTKIRETLGYTEKYDVEMGLKEVLSHLSSIERTG